MVSHWPRPCYAWLRNSHRTIQCVFRLATCYHLWYLWMYFDFLLSACLTVVPVLTDGAFGTACLGNGARCYSYGSAFHSLLY